MRIGLARLKPSTDEWVDAAFVVATTGLSLIGFRRSFGGWDFLTAGLLGCVVAMLVAHLLHRWAVPMLLKFGLGALALLVFAGPVALRDEALAGVLPSPAAVFGVVDGLVSGWRRLLTTLPPSGSYGNLLAIPYVCGYLSGAIGITLSRSPKRVASLLLTSATVLVASLLFGTRTPFSVVLQGALYACAAIGWLAVRRSRDHRRYLVAVGPKRLIAASAMLAVVGSLGLVVGPRLPFAEASERFVLRDRTEPPFDPRSFGSPLNAFQRYLVGPLKDVDLFHIDGIPADVFDARSGTALVRLAVLDEYDGVVWQVSPGGGSVASERSGRFVRVGDEIPRDAMGETATITVAVMGLPGVWLPDLGTVTG